MELKDLNPEQRVAVKHNQGPLLVVAGAGTGKTQVIIRRAAYLIAKGLAKPNQILAVTFTDKAAKEMEERLDLLLPYGLVDTKIMTFHSFGDEILRQYGSDVGLASHIGLLNEAQQKLFLKRHLDELKLEYFAPISDPTALLGHLATYFARLKEELVSPQDYVGWAKSLAATATEAELRLEAAKQLELAQAYQTYQTLMRREGLIDFADQVSLALDLLQQRPNILAQLRRDIRYIMVDEFQDTNLAQARLIETLAGPDGNLMVVGDDDQSIYKFRGASISNILDFTQRYPKAKQVVLTTNYRSTQELLDSAYRLIQQNNPERLEEKIGINKRLVSQRRGELPKVESFSTLSQEANSLAKKVASHLKDGLKPSEIAILVRKKKQAEPVIKALEQEGVRYQFSAQERLFEQPIVKSMLSFLQYMADPNEDVCLYSILASSIFKADATNLANLAALARRHNHSLDRQIRLETGFEHEVVQKLDRLRQKAHQLTTGELLFAFLDETGYLNELAKAAESSTQALISLQSLSKLFEQIEQHQKIWSDKSVFGFVSAIGLLEGVADAATEPDVETDLGSVQIMTMHRSKGLEFEQVYLINLTSDSLPSRQLPEALVVPDALLAAEHLPGHDWHLAEDRRLMYVAMTRAKTGLHLSYAVSHGGARSKRPSIFLTEALGHKALVQPTHKVTPLEQIKLIGTGADPGIIRPEFATGKRVELTAQQVNDYIDCPLNFYWKHVLKVPSLSSPIMLYGTAIHATISFYYSQRRHRSLSLAELVDYFKAIWKIEGYPSVGQEERRLKQAQQTLKLFYNREESTQTWPDHIEEPFNFELAEAVRVRGRYDAVYETKKGVEIRDFKTSQVEKGEKASQRAKESRQLAIYALGWFKLTGQVPAKLTLDFVETSQIGQTTKSQADLEKLAREIVEMAAQIKAGNFPPGKNHFHCIHDKL